MSKELEYEINNFANLLHKDCMNLMECLKKQNEDNKPILYLGKHYEKVILPLEEYQKMCNRLESIDNANPSEALECLEYIENKLRGLRVECERIKNHRCDDVFIQEHTFDTIKQALLKAQEQELHNGGRLPNKEILYLKQSLEQGNDKPIFYVSRTYGNKYIVPQKQLDDLVKEKELLEATIEDLRKDITLLKEQKTKKYLKWEDLEFKELEFKVEQKKDFKVKLNDTEYGLEICITFGIKEALIFDEKKVLYAVFHERHKQFFNDLHLERVEE